MTAGSDTPHGFPGHRPGEPAYRQIGVALFCAGVTTFALLYAPQTVLPELAGAFGLSAAQAALAVSFATVSLGLALLLVGPVTETVGRTPILHASLFATAAVGMACAVAPTWASLLALRAVQGVALAGVPAVAIAYLREEVAVEAHGTATGLYVGGTALGGLLGRLVVGGVAQLAGWRWALFAIAAVGLGCAFVTRALLPASRNFRPRPRGAGLAGATRRRLMTDPVLLAVYGIGGVAMGSFVAIFNAIGFRLRAEPYLLSLAAAGLVYLPHILGAFTSTYAGRLTDRFGQRAVMPFAIATMLAGMLVSLAVPLPVVFAGVALVSAGFFAVHGVASGWVAARAQLGGGGTGQATAMYLFVYYLGSAVFGSVAGAAWTAGGWPRVVLLTGALMSVGLALALLLRRIPPLEPRRDPDADVSAL